MRAKTSNRIASLVSPCATTSRILTTPTLSPSTEVVVEMAKERWRVDKYDIMKGLIHVRSKKENSYETKNIVDGHLEVEKRLNSDLRRFEMTEGIRLQDFNRDNVFPEKSVIDGGESDDNGDY
ncbi:unnamed protein product [Vicia faba]|uniref:Uncharacterized protein n=1 Tax=Vicia faba TaxID=3906 RepID=A0AAV0YWA9_VICFA|nr:unnamed protein product [Vicia faba]